MTFGGALTLEKNGYLAAAQLSMVEVQKNHLSDSDRCCNTPNWQQYMYKALLIIPFSKESLRVLKANGLWQQKTV